MLRGRAIRFISAGGCLIASVLYVASSSFTKGIEAEGRLEFSNSAIPASAIPAEHPKTGKAACKDCHADIMKHKNPHPPATEGCDTCHELKETGEKAEVKLAMEVGELCATCHPDKREDLQKKTSKHPPAEDNCTNCHDPHATDNVRLLKMPLEELCVTCHPERQEEFDKKKFSHSPVRELGCTTCHEPHATNNKPLLKAETNNVCLACHRYKRNEVTYGADEKFMIFPDTSIPAAYPSRASKVILGSDGKGHPFIGHPIGGIPDPSHKGRPLSCISCHNPHAGNFKQLFQDDIRGQELCLRCHK